MRASVSAHDYERDFRPHQRGRVVDAAHTAALAWLQVASGQRVLDLGCGTGPLLPMLEAAGARPIGLDYSPRSLAVARAELTAAWLVRGDARTLPFPDACFDRVAALGVLGYLAPGDLSTGDLARGLGECARVLRPGGMLLICTGRRLNAVGSLALRLQRPAPGDRRTRSYLHAGRVHRLLVALGLRVEAWSAWPAAPRTWWAPLVRPFFAAGWFRASKPTA